MSQRTFCYPNEIDNDWSDPLEMSDSDRFQVEFSLGYTNEDGTIDIKRRPDPENFGTYTTEDEWRDASRQQPWNWTDGEVSNPVWMITCNRVDGIWTEWSVMRVLAEKGAKGDPGTSVKIEGKFDSLTDLKAEWEKYKVNPETYTGIFVLPLEQGDGYLVDGYLYVYSGHYDDDTTFEECWLNAGQIKGEPGDNAVTYELFIRYSDFSDGNPMKSDGIGGKYIGTLSTFKKDDGSYDKDPTKYGSYTWSPWSGEDGWGYEQVFLCTSATSGFDFSNPLPVPTESKAVLDFRPKHDYEENVAHGEIDDEGNAIWSDRPIPTSAEWPYCWSVSRKVKGLKFEEWTGAKYGDIEGAEIYDRYIRDGHEIYHLELSEDQIDIPMDGDMVDEDFNQELLTTATFYIGNDTEDDGVTYDHNGPTNAIQVENNEIKVTNWNALIGRNKITIFASLDGIKVAQKDVYLHFTPNAYSLSTDVKILTRDLITDTVNPYQVTVTAKKWNGKEWLPASGHYITVDCNHLSSDYENNHTNSDYELNSDGTYTINLDQELSLSSIDIYLKKNTNDESANLAWEHIGVVQNGEDGTNIEYIYLLKNEEIAPDNPTPLNESGEPNLGGDYQNPEWKPSNSDWEDNPQNISTTNKYQYVAVRERKNGIWGSFSNPVLWSVYSEKGDNAISYKHAFAFCRTNTDISEVNVTGGTFADPKPNSTNDILWEDSVPSGEAQLWMVSCVVDSDSNTCKWSKPKLMTDTADLQIEYTLQNLGVLDSYSPIKFDDPKVLTNMTDGKSQEDAWRELEAESDEKVVWNDNVPNALYMAVATCHNGVWSDWSVVRIKGEPGDKGDPGTSVKIVGSAYKVNTNPTTLNNKYSTTEEEVTKYWIYLYYNNSMYYWNESTYEKVELGIDGTGTGIIIDGDLYVWDADSWENVGQVRGPAGTSSHLYVKRADSLNPSSFNNNGKYIGYYVSETVMTDPELDQALLEQPSKWNWTKWNGDDGWGYEEIFLLTKTDTPVKLPSESRNEKDYCPPHNTIGAYGSNWSDIFLLPNETYPYCWKAKREVTASNYAGAWYGDKNGKAILCDVYVKDGVSAYHLELTNDQGIIPIENGKEEDVTLETTMMLYAGDTLIDEEDGVEYSIEYGNTNESLDSGSISISNSELTNIETITCVATHNGNQFKKEFKILRTENAYEIRPNVEVFHRDLSTNKLTNGNCKVYVSKWNHYRDLYQSLNGEKVYFTCYGIDGEPLTIGGHSYGTINNGVASFDLSNISGIDKVEFYLVLSDNTHISEVVGVVTNGNDSYASEAIYILGTEKDVPSNPTPIESQRDNYNSSEWLPSKMFDEDKTEYTNKNGKLITKEVALQWSDNPLKINDTKNYCYVSIRKFNTNTKTWGDFSDPVPYSCKIKGDSAISSNITAPTLFKKQSDNTLINKTIYVNVNSYIGSTRRKIAEVTIDEIDNDKIRYDDYTFEFDYDSSIPNSTITFNVTIRFNDDEGILRESMTCNVYTKVNGENAISPIAVHLSNPSVELSWYANGDAITNSAECIVTSVRGNTPLPITIGRGYYDAFQITYTRNGSQNVLVSIYASSKIPPGQYTISLPLTIAGTTLIRDINVTVKEIPNDTINIVMDEHHTVGCSKKVIWSKTTRSTRTTFPDTGPTLPNPDQVLVWDWTLLDTSIYQPINEICEIKYEPNVVIPVTIFVNGVPYKEWSIDSISLGDTVLTSGTDFGLVKLQYSNSGSVSISAKPILECMGETAHYINGQITFKIGNESIGKNVIFHELNESSELTTTWETDILPLSANYGETIKPYIVTKRYGDNGWEERYRGGDITYAFRIEGEDEYFTPGTRAIEITDNLKIHVYRVEYQRQCETDEYGEWCQDDIDHPDYTELFSQTISCIKQPKLDIWTLESETQFAQISPEALTGNGKLVGEPIKLIVKHYNGDEVTVYDSITEILPYRICAWMEGNKYCGLTTSTLQFDQPGLYKTTAPIKFTLEDDNGEVKDSIEIEKTIVYPNPLIYPAGEYTANKSYKINYSQVPYIFIKTSSGDIKYYVGNRDVLKDNVELDLKNTISINGDNIEINDIDGFLTWNPMESFEAIYADIGVLNQALVGPLVFYKDYVFSQDGILNKGPFDVTVSSPLGEQKYTAMFKSFIGSDGIQYEPNSVVSYSAMLGGELYLRYFAGGTTPLELRRSFNNIWTYIEENIWTPNYFLNAKTGELKFGNSFHYANGETTLTLGDHIVLNGETGTIKLDETSDWGNSKLTIGDEDFFWTRSTSGGAYVGKFAINPILQAGCYGGGVCEIDAYDHGKSTHHIASNCIGETFDNDEIPALTVSSNTGTSICNFTGGIYGLRTGVGGNQSYDWSYSSVTFKPQTLIYNRYGQYTLTLPNPEYAQGGDFIDVYKFTTDYFYIKGARFKPLAGGDEISDDLYQVSSDNTQLTNSISINEIGWYRCLFNPNNNSWYVMKLPFSDIV